MPTLPPISPEVFKAYQNEVSASTSPATAKRKEASLNRFFDWAAGAGHIPANPVSRPETSNAFVITPKKSRISTRTWAVVGITTSMVVLVFLLLYQLKFPIQFIKSFAQESKIQTGSNQSLTGGVVPKDSTGSGTFPAVSAGNQDWNLFAKLKLTDANGSPRVGSETMSFKIFDAPQDGTALYTSDPQPVTTDSEGSALISLSNVPSSLFFQNNELYLEPQGASGSATARIPVSTANTGANLGGFFPADPDIGAGPLTVPVIDSTGSLLLASESPAIKAKEGNLLIEGQTVTVKTTDGGGGNIEINPDANGIAHFLFEGNKGNFLNAQGPNLTSGSLYYGMVPNNATGYDLIRLQSGAPKMKTRFSVDALGNTYIAGNENVIGNISTNSVVRLTSGGALQNITGYSQVSGNFTITQSPGDFASINKTVTSGGALSDVLTLTLDERGKPATSNSDYSTLVLNRYDGNNAGAALKVNTGNAIFNGQLELGRFAALPSAIGAGSLVFNTGDNLVYVWNGTSWVAVGSSTISFDNITSGNNTTATMVVDSGASLSFSGSGTITASDVTCAGCVSNAELANSTITFAGNTGSTAISLGGTENIIGGTTITTDQTGSTLTINVADDSLDFAQFQDALDLDASTDINLGAFTLSTSGTGALDFGSTGQVTFDGNIDATNGLDVTGSITQNTFGVCDSSGANCPFSGGYWNQALGALFPTSATVDVLIGSSATASADFAFTGVNGGLPTASIAGNIAGVATYLTGNGNLATTNFRNLTLGGVTTGNIIVNPSNSLAGGYIAPTTTDVTDLGVSSALEFRNIYGQALFQNSFAVCDSSGANCPSSGGFWDQTNGALYPINNTVDVLIGSSATASADFAFTGVNGGLPTASIAGNIANVATYLTGNGNLATTNFQNLTLGGLTTGNIILNPSNSLAGGYVAPTTTDVTDLGVSSALEFRNIYGQALFQNSFAVCDSSGANCPSGASLWTQTAGALYPTNSSVDVLIGSSATTSAKFAFINVLTGTPTASIAGSAAGISAYLTGNGNLATTNFQNLTLGGLTTGNIIVNPSNSLAGGYIAPTTTDVTDLGVSSSLEFRNIYGQALFQNSFAVCDSSGANCPASGGFWAQANGALYPINNTVDVLIGSDATASADFAFTGVNGGLPTASIAGNITDVATYLTGNGTLSTTNAQALTLGSSTTGNVVINSRGSDALTANGINLTAGGDIAINGNDISSPGDLTITPSGGQLILADTATLNVGGKTNVGYNAFANAADSPAISSAISTDNDLFIGGDLELKGGLYLTGKNIYNTVGSVATGTISFAADPSLVDNVNTLGNGSWLVQNDANAGIAALMVNQTFATPDIFTASAGGTMRFKIANDGTTTILTTNAATVASLVVSDSSGTGTGKIDVGTVDPPYTINGKKYATFLSGMVGVKEETAGLTNTNEYVPGVGYRSIIDFNNLPEGSDLWLFGKSTNIKENMDKLVALLTPSSSTKVWYDIDRSNKRIVIYSARPTEISYRLTGPRFDYISFPNQRSDDNPTAGFIINSLDIINNSPVTANVQLLSSFVTQKIQDGYYILKDSSGTIVDGVESIGNFVAGNIKAGAIESKEIATNSFNAVQSTVDNLLVTTGLVTPRAQIALISPIPGGTDVTVRIGNDSTSSGKLAIQDKTGAEVASIDTQGNASFAGNVNSQNIDEIQAMLNQVALDQSVLLAATSGANLSATGSANISQLIATDLFVTGHAAISNLMVNDNLSTGNINSLSGPLKLQSLALAPVEIMAGLVTIDTHGNVLISGDLNVAGKITTPQLDTGIINATGSSTFNSISTEGLIIGAPDATVSGVVANGEINTNSTIGKAVIPAGVSEITIKNPKVTDYTLVYVTPTSDTLNNVLYIKSKQAGQFVVGFTNPLSQDAYFNWWIVQIQ